MKKVRIPVEHQEIGGILLTPQKPDGRAVILVHGWTSSNKGYVKRAKALVDQQIACLAISLRGHDGSDGDIRTVTRENNLRDIRAAYKFMSDLPDTNPDKIGIFGKSYGGYLTAILAANLLPKTVIVCAPALYPDSDFNKPTQSLINKNPNIYRSYGLSNQDNKALASFSCYPNPMLLITLSKDEDIPKPTTENYISFKPNNLTVKTIKDSDHTLSDPQWNQKLIQIMTKWFIRFL